MERRSEERVCTEQKLVLTLIGKERRKMDARAVDTSGSGIRVRAPGRALPGDPVKINIHDSLLLGEVCYCRPDGGGFLIGIEVDQALNHLDQLAELNRILLQDADGAGQSASLARTDQAQYALSTVDR